MQAVGGIAWLGIIEIVFHLHITTTEISFLRN